MELYKKYRPTTLAQMVGQPAQIAKLRKLKEIPHSILLSGPSGVGKTTLAMILARDLGCPPNDNNPNFTLKNCADCRSIEDIRSIRDEMKYSPLNGKARVWILDETMQIPQLSQNALLQMLEKTPPQTYFFLCTTEPGTLLTAIRTRCFPVVLKPIKDADLMILLIKVSKEEKIKVSGNVMLKIAVMAEGSARFALVLLESILNETDEDAQLQILKSDQVNKETAIIKIARDLAFQKPWSVVSKGLESLTADPETVRRVILAYAQKMLMGSKQHNQQVAYAMIQSFAGNLRDSGKAGLVAACYECCKRKD